MSYCLTSGTIVSASHHNGRSRAVTGRQTPERSGWELLAWEMLQQAVDDTKILCRYGLINRAGELREWPRVQVSRDGYLRTEPMIIANFKDPLEHVRLREFWLDETQAQLWCDLCGWHLPARDTWNALLKNHAK